jgi:hypothetical protein
MAQHERHRDQRGSYENPRGYARPRRRDFLVPVAALPGVAAASVLATKLSPDPVGVLTRGHLLTPRQPIECRKSRRELGVRCGSPARQLRVRCSHELGLIAATSIKPGQAVAFRQARRSSRPPASSRRQTESSTVRAAALAVGGAGPRRAGCAPASPAPASATEARSSFRRRGVTVVPLG